MDSLMTAMADHQSLAPQRDHLLYPQRFLLASCPALPQIHQFADVVNFAVPFRVTDFAAVGPHSGHDLAAQFIILGHLEVVPAVGDRRVIVALCMADLDHCEWDA